MAKDYDLFAQGCFLSDGVEAFEGNASKKTAAEGHTLFTGSAGIVNYC